MKAEPGNTQSLEGKVGGAAARSGNTDAHDVLSTE